MPVGGVARYEADHFHRMVDDSSRVPENPWFICTLWLAEWYIARAQTAVQLRRALPIFEWVVDHALPSGVLAEQVHPKINDAVSVLPLTWSHAAFVSAMDGYHRKLQRIEACPTCGQLRQCSIIEPVAADPLSMAAAEPMH